MLVWQPVAASRALVLTRQPGVCTGATPGGAQLALTPLTSLHPLLPLVSLITLSTSLHPLIPLVLLVTLSTSLHPLIPLVLLVTLIALVLLVSPAEVHG